MRTKLFFVIAFLLVIAYGCQDETTTEMTETVLSDDAPTLVENNASLDGPVEEFPTEAKETQTLTLNDHPIVQAEANGEEVLSRSSYNLQIPATALKSLHCGSNFTQTLYDNNNYVSNSVYNHFGYSADLNGRDEIYHLNITQRSIVTINLTNTSRNLAMTLFKADVNFISINPLGIYAKLTLNNVLDVTTSSSEYSDQVGPIDLAPGSYVLVIDSKINQSSNYKLQVNCTPVYTGCVPGTTRLIYDNFENYQYGPIAAQGYYWLKWYPVATHDATVSGSSTNKYLSLVRSSSATSSNQPNVLWRFGYRYTGSYAHKMLMWVPSSRSAYLSIQKRLSYGNAYNETGAQIYFKSGGVGEIRIGGSTYAFSYAHNKWMDVQLTMNLDANRTYFYIDGQLKGSWPCTMQAYSTTGSKSIEAIQFYPYASNSLFYLDNLCFSKW